jgi:hypothetical protein
MNQTHKTQIFFFLEKIVQALKTPYMFVWSLNLKSTTTLQAFM